MIEEIIRALGVVGIVVGVVVIVAMIAITRLIVISSPNEVLIFTGSRRRLGNREVGYNIVKGGRGLRIPLLMRVDRLELTNMVIEVNASGAYSKGGVPLNVQGVANVKIAGHEPVLNNAIERFLGKSRVEIMQIAKATLEGSLRGVLATMTPEQVNEDKLLFAERLVQEVEQDMTSLGLVVDTLTIQNVQDDVSYLNSIGRKQNAEIVSSARIAEATAGADALERKAENLEREVAAQIKSQIGIAKAEAERKLNEIRTRRDALVAEELASVAAMVAKSKAEVDVQKAKVEQIRRKLEADVVAPARATCEAMENAAKAETAPILEEGRARADGLRKLVEGCNAAGENGPRLMLLQKLPSMLDMMGKTIGNAPIEKLTMIGSGSSGGSTGDNWPGKLMSFNEQAKQIFGVDVVEMIRQRGQPQEPAKSPTIVVQPALPPEPEATTWEAKKPIPSKPEPPEAPSPPKTK